MKSSYLTLAATFTIVAIGALIIAVVYDGMDNSQRSIVFGCVACTCTIPAFTSAKILFKSADKEMAKKEADETAAEKAVVDTASTEDINDKID